MNMLDIRLPRKQSRLTLENMQLHRHTAPISPKSEGSLRNTGRYGRKFPVTFKCIDTFLYPAPPSHLRIQRDTYFCGQIHTLDDFLGMHFPKRSADYGKILGSNANRSPIDQPVTCYNSFARASTLSIPNSLAR